jgi:hypothetical protein
MKAAFFIAGDVFDSVRRWPSQREQVRPPGGRPERLRRFAESFAKRETCHCRNRVHTV